MRIGCPVCWRDGALDKGIRQAHALGYTYVELDLEWPWLPEELTRNRLKAARRALKETGLAAGVHGPFPPVVHHSALIRKAAQASHAKGLEAARKVDAEYYNLHLKGEELAYKGWFEEEQTRALHRAVEKNSTAFLQEITAKGNEAGIALTLENNTSGMFAELKTLSSLLSKVPRLQFCFDIGHVIKSSPAAYKGSASFEKWFRKIGRRTLVVHLHDARIEKGRAKDHLPLGKGEVDIPPVLRKVQATPCNYLLLETFPVRNASWRATAQQNLRTLQRYLPG